MIIGEIIQSDTNKIVFSIEEYKGKKRFDIREQFKKKDMKDWCYTKKGVKFELKDIPTVVSLTEKAEDLSTKGA